MKKKDLKNLKLTKYRISNLALLHRKNGGNVGNNNAIATTAIGNEISMDVECSASNPSNVSECYTSFIIDCQCQTNAGTTRAQPPSEHQTCNAKPGFSNDR